MEAGLDQFFRGAMLVLVLAWLSGHAYLNLRSRWRRTRR